MSAQRLVSRPAETTGVGATVGSLLAYVAGVRDPEVIVTMAAVIGLLPGAVTFLTDNGGIRGVVRRAWRGR